MCIKKTIPVFLQHHKGKTGLPEFFRDREKPMKTFVPA